MHRYRTFALALVFLPGCFLFFPPDGGPIGGDLTGLSTLKRFESEQELTDYFKGEISGRSGQVSFEDDFGRSDAEIVQEGDLSLSPADGGAAGAIDADSALGTGASSPDGSQATFSDTTIQEVGVDEADVVKTDGSYLYIIHDKTLRIVRVAPRDQFGLVAELELEGYGRELYLHDGKVIALTETYGGYFGFGGGIILPEPLIFDDVLAGDDLADSTDTGSSGSVEGSASSDTPPAVDAGTSDTDGQSDASTDVDAASDELIADGIDSSLPPIDLRYERPRTIVTIFDISARDHPERLSKTSFVGTQSSSRMIDGVLHLVVANFQQYFVDVVPFLGRPEVDLSAVDGRDFLPTFEQIDAEGNLTSGPLVTWENMYRPTDSDGFGVVTVVSMDTNGRSADFSAVGIVAEPGLIYSSTDALYLTDTNWDFFGNARETTDIYKLVYDQGGAVPVATGTVRGRIMSQYWMGEHEGYLRVATTVGPVFSPLGQVRQGSNSVYVLEKSDAKLVVSGRIENIAPGETIQSARFLGDRGYLVTFREVDPLFTLDLADPHDPHIVGVLKVPGFSTFMVPMDEDHLLTIGEYVPGDGRFFGRGVQLSIFDVSNFAKPTLKHLEIVGGDESVEAWSEALNNPKAFTYFAQAGLVALPIEIYNFGFFFEGDVVFLDGSEVAGDELLFAPQDFRGLAVYRVSVDGGFESVGRIDTDFDDGFYWTAFTRGVFIDDDIFAVTNQGVRGAAVADMASITHDVQFEQFVPGFIDDHVIDIGVLDAAGEPEPAP